MRGLRFVEPAHLLDDFRMGEFDKRRVVAIAKRILEPAHIGLDGLDLGGCFFRRVGSFPAVVDAAAAGKSFAGSAAESPIRGGGLVADPQPRSALKKSAKRIAG